MPASDGVGVGSGRRLSVDAVAERPGRRYGRRCDTRRWNDGRSRRPCGAQIDADPVAGRRRPRKRRLPDDRAKADGDGCGRRESTCVGRPSAVISIRTVNGGASSAGTVFSTLEQRVAELLLVEPRSDGRRVGLPFRRREFRLRLGVCVVVAVRRDRRPRRKEPEPRRSRGRTRPHGEISARRWRSRTRPRASAPPAIVSSGTENENRRWPSPSGPNTMPGTVATLAVSSRSRAAARELVRSQDGVFGKTYRAARGGSTRNPRPAARDHRSRRSDIPLCHSVTNSGPLARASTPAHWVGVETPLVE